MHVILPVRKFNIASQRLTCMDMQSQSRVSAADRPPAARAPSMRACCGRSQHQHQHLQSQGSHHHPPCLLLPHAATACPPRASAACLPARTLHLWDGRPMRSLQAKQPCLPCWTCGRAPAWGRPWRRLNRMKGRPDPGFCQLCPAMHEHCTGSASAHAMACQYLWPARPRDLVRQR